MTLSFRSQNTAPRPTRRERVRQLHHLRLLARLYRCKITTIMRCIPRLLIFWTLFCSGVSQNLRQVDNEARTTSTTTTTTTGEHATTTARRQAQAMVGIDALIQAFQESRTRLLNRLQTEYGPSYQAMFVDTHPNRTDTLSTIGRNAFYKGTANAPTAWERTKRKMMIRILQYMSEGKIKDYVWATA